MKLAPLFLEVFYSPFSFFRLRRNQKTSFYFISIFSILSYVILVTNLSYAVKIKLNFFQVFLATLLFVFSGFAKSSLYSAFINMNETKVKFKDIWLIQTISLYPIVLFLPILSFLSFWPSVFWIGYLFIILTIHYLRKRMIEKLLGVKAPFVWYISFIQFIFGLFLFLIYIGFSMNVLLRFLVG